MSLDVAGLLAAAAGDPRSAAALKPIVRDALRDALSESAADSWLSVEQAARYVYGSDGKSEAFRKVIARNADLARLAAGPPRMRRFRRVDLDAWLANNTRAQGRRKRAE